jgi:DNA polymerase III subunit gamma/tau
MLALARLYRSRNFQELVGQAHVVQALTHALTEGRLHHAYLLTGTRGVGKTTIARILAKSLNCETGITATPCGVCSVCTSIDSGRYVDLLELDAASNTGIDNMRDILENAHYAPTTGRYKVYLIDEVHMLSKGAFNAMLKTLEEPPEHVKFVLATTDPQKIPITVLSRCLQFNLKPLPVAQIDGHLQAILQKEKLTFEPAATLILARAAEGSMRDALSMTDQAIAHESGKLTEVGVRAMLGVADRRYVHRILQTLQSADGTALLNEALTIQSHGLSFDSVLQELAHVLHQLALLQSVPNLPASVLADMGDAAALKALADGFSVEQVQVLYQIATQSRADLPLAPDAFAGFNMALLRLLAFVPKGSIEAAPMPAKAPRAVAQVAIKPHVSVAVKPETVKLEPAKVEPVKAVAATINFDGDWPALIQRLPLNALTRELARNCVLGEHNATTFQLALSETSKHLRMQEAKLAANLTEYFGRTIRLEISLADSTATLGTVAESDRAARNEAQAVAETGFANDPFVRTLMQETGARIIPNSVTPGEPHV